MYLLNGLSNGAQRYYFCKQFDIFYFLISPHRGYQQREAFILTQAPLENTIQDFWRMLWEYEVISVVMISSAKERDMVSSQSIYLVGLKQIVSGLQITAVDR